MHSALTPCSAFRVPRSAFLALVALVLLVTACHAADSTYYVDSDWAGTQSGTQAQPWKSLTASAWNTINSDLSNNAVVVYFSARTAGSDADQFYSATGSTSVRDNIDLTSKTNNTSAHRLTLDGNSQWNSNDSTPSWSAYSGTSKCTSKMIYSQNPSLADIRNITIKAFHVVTDNSQKAVSVSGSSTIVDGCVLEGGNPSLQLVPTANAAHEGSSEPAPVLTNIFFVNNHIFNTHGEGIYVGGGGTNPGEAGSGYPSHHGLWVTNNFIHDCAAGSGAGGQGDGIDVKGGIYDLTIAWNTISNLTDPTVTGIRGIVAQGQYGGTNGNVRIHGNRIYGCTVDDSAIASVNSWGTPNNVSIYNNIVYNNTSGSALRFYPNDGSMAVFNNTIVSNADVAIRVDTGASLVVTNNLLFNNGSQQFDISGTVTHNYNLYAGTLGTTAAGNESSTTTAANLVDPVGLDFSLRSTAPARDAGVSISSFSTDILGRSRPQGSAWDIGAHEFRLPWSFNTVNAVNVTARSQ